MDRAKHKAEELAGKVKEKAGEITGDEHRRHEGQADQAKGNMKQAGDKAKGALDDATDAIKH
jgi:uncharacterized protein YjbJ (UPF0337 family)